MILLKEVLDLLLLIAPLVNVVAPFFSILALGLAFQDFFRDLSLRLLVVAVVVRGLNLNVMLHALLQEAFIVKGFEHLHQRADLPVLYQIFLVAVLVKAL